MPIEYRIDHERRLVLAEGKGVLTHKDIVGYQREVWTRPEVQGFDELVDMSNVAEIAGTSAVGVREIAEVSVATDPPEGTPKFAIVAPGDLAFALGRMYESFREITPGSKKEVAVFRTRDEAFAWLEKEAE